MVYVCLAFNTRGKLRKQTTDCGGIVLTFDIHMSTPLAQRHVPPRDRVITASRPYPMATKVAQSAPPKSWALRATWGC